jgi:hypothetical protein
MALWVKTGRDIDNIHHRLFPNILHRAGDITYLILHYSRFGNL